MGRSAVWISGLALWALFLVSSAAASREVSGNEGLAGAERERTQGNDTVFATFEIDGEIIDCIDIYKQPAFSLPSLVNHTIQMEPTDFPERIITADDDPEGESRPWFLPKSCPKGSIPIRRYQSSSEHSHSDDDDPPSAIRHRHRHRHLVQQREIRSRKVDDVQNFEAADVYFPIAKYNGGKAIINLWNPRVEAGELSSSFVGLTLKDSDIHLDAGWMVYPDMYNGDSRTRFFVRWTPNRATQPMCYNIRCPGFVHTNPRFITDPVLHPISIYGGQQTIVQVAIAKDQKTLNWWVYMQNWPMGYWPKDVMSGFEDSAEIVTFAGEIYNSKPGGQHTDTEMGSGHFPDEGFRKASYFKNVQVYDHRYSYVTPGADDVQVEAKRPECYDTQAVEDKRKMGSWGYFFYYGGPGRTAGGKCS